MNPDTAPLTWGYFFSAVGFTAGFLALGYGAILVDRMRGEWRRFREWKHFDEWEQELRRQEAHR